MVQSRFFTIFECEITMKSIRSAPGRCYSQAQHARSAGALGLGAQARRWFFDVFETRTSWNRRIGGLRQETHIFMKAKQISKPAVNQKRGIVQQQHNQDCDLWRPRW